MNFPNLMKVPRFSTANNRESIIHGGITAIETCVIKNSILSVAFTNYQMQGPCCHLAVGGVRLTDTVYIRLFMGLGSVEQLICYL